MKKIVSTTLMIAMFSALGICETESMLISDDIQ